MWSACEGLSSQSEGSPTAMVLGFSGTGGFSLSSIPFLRAFTEKQLVFLTDPAV